MKSAPIKAPGGASFIMDALGEDGGENYQCASETKEKKKS